VNVIKPATEPSVFDSNDAAITALKNKQSMRSWWTCPRPTLSPTSRWKNAVTIGKFQATSTDYFSLVLAKGSPDTVCVNQAIKALTDDGTLKSLVTKWLRSRTRSRSSRPRRAAARRQPMVGNPAPATTLEISSISRVPAGHHSSGPDDPVARAPSARP